MLERDRARLCSNENFESGRRVLSLTGGAGGPFPYWVPDRSWSSGAGPDIPLSRARPARRSFVGAGLFEKQVTTTAGSPAVATGGEQI